jgi:hypothetical protein
MSPSYRILDLPKPFPREAKLDRTRLLERRGNQARNVKRSLRRLRFLDGHSCRRPPRHEELAAVFVGLD